MTKLSVNINKIATIRNARGGDTPSVSYAAQAAESFGAEGITVHPRPDERHIRYTDVLELKKIVKTEFNIEGYPSSDFIKLIEEIRPEQVTLVPDPPDVLTSNAGWDCKSNIAFLSDTVAKLKSYGVRVSLFLDPDPSQLDFAKQTGTDRIELYTEAYAAGYKSNKKAAIAPYIRTANEAVALGLGINAGHDLSLENLAYFIAEIPQTLEVSIGHALISDSLYYGLNNSIQMYLHQIAKGANGY